MSRNDAARRDLERLFGKICFIEKLGIRYIPPKDRKKLKGYSKYDDVITYHHIQERHTGGKATVENGALVRGYNHKWLHSLPDREKQLVNDAMQEYKASVLRAKSKGVDIQPEDILTPEDLYQVLQFAKITNLAQFQNKRNQKFNRAKEKQEARRIIEEALYGDEEDERF